MLSEEDEKKAILKTINSCEFEFKPYCVQQHKFNIIQSKLEKGEFIIKEIYNDLHYPSHTFDNMYITNFGNMLSMNISMLNGIINNLIKNLLSLISRDIYMKITSSNTTTVYQYLNIKPNLNSSGYFSNKKNLFLQLYGCELDCCCNHFNGDNLCNSEGKTCLYPFYKASCNKNTELESFLVDVIKNHDFNGGIPIGLKSNDIENKVLCWGGSQWGKSFSEQFSGEEIIKCFNECRFGGFLKERIINFIEEIRRTSVEI